MATILICRVTQLLYLDAPRLNFAKVVSDILKTLVAPGSVAPALTWDCDDIALLDFKSGRIIIGYSENLPGVHSACLTIGVGQSSLSAVDQLAQSELDLLCQGVTDPLARQFPSDAKTTQILDRALTPDLIDQVVDRLFETDQDSADAVEDLTLDTQSPSPSSAEPGDMDRLLSRLSSELVARPPNLISRAIAQATLKRRVAEQLMERPPQDHPAPTKQSKARRAGGGFWQVTKGKSAIRAAGCAHASSSELKAIREALYATDAKRQHGVGMLLNSRLVLQAMSSIQSLATLQGGIASTVADLRRGNERSIRH